MQINLPLTEPQEEFVYHDAPRPALVAGLGCVHGDTRIHTHSGLARMKDIDPGTLVISYDQSQNKFRHSVCSGSFVKGRSRLYKVTLHSESLTAAGNHKVLMDSGEYRKVDDLNVGDFVREFKNKVKVTSISVQDHEEDYYDMQVPGDNNYVCEAGIIHHNSGKTHGGITRLISRMLENRNVDTAYYMPTYDLLRLRVLPGVESNLSQMGLRYQTNKSEYTVSVKGYGKMILRSFDRPQRIIAYEVGHSVIDELDTVKRDVAAEVYRKIVERNRQIDNGSVGIVTTPDQGYSGFIYQKWGKNPEPGYVVINAPTSSNPTLPDDYEQNIRDNYDPILADVFIRGHFVSLSRNKVYHFYDRQKHYTDREITDDDKRLNVSIDFNVGGCCATTWVEENNMPHAVDEFVSHNTNEFIHNLEKRYSQKNRIITVYPDASGKASSTNAAASDIAIIEGAGFRVDAPNKNPFIRDRINSANALFAHNRIRINSDKCPELVDALEIQGYDANGDPEKFKEHPSVDDWTDSAGYLLNQRYSVNRITNFRRI